MQLKEWTIALCIAGVGLFLYHAFRAWGSLPAFIGLALLIGILIAVGCWDLHRSSIEIEFDEDEEPPKTNKPI